MFKISKHCKTFLSFNKYISVCYKMSKRKELSDERKNADIVEFLIELAEYEKNVERQMHKYNAYRKAAGAIQKHPVQILSGDEAKKLDGVGVKIAKKIDEFLTTGKLEKLEKIRANDTNKAIHELTRVTGIGPAAAKKFVDEGITTIDELRKHVDKLNHHQQVGLRHFEDFEKKIPRDEMQKLEAIIISELAKLDPEYKCEICGSYRRGAASSGDIDILLTHPLFLSTDNKKSELLHVAVKHLESVSFITDSLGHGDSKFMGVCRLQPEGNKEFPYRRIDIRLVPADQYILAVLYFTGNDEFNKAMRRHAIEQGFTLNEYSLRPIGSTGVPGEPVGITTEKDVFDFINFPFKEAIERNW